MIFHRVLLLLGLPVCVPALAAAQAPTTRPAWGEVSVHDPAVLKAGGTWYVFGSHLAAAKSTDLIAWTLIDSGVHPGNRIIPDAVGEMHEAFAWGQASTFWAPVVRQFPDGRFYHYYCVCKGDSARSALGLALADGAGEASGGGTEGPRGGRRGGPEGPYRNAGVLLKSGMWGQPSEDGSIYDPEVHPNAVDPDVFFDARGQPWMVYGSYSGGIFIVKLDVASGRPIAGQGYGKRLAGGFHSRIEGPSVLYHPKTGYYYLLLSFGGLGADGGYQVRVFRSRNPDGPYVDPNGRDAAEAHGPRGSFFDDKALEPFGLKVIGNHVWGLGGEGAGYLSPGHCSAAYDAETGRSFLFFHTRFPVARGRLKEAHEVRVHQLLFTEDGWPLVAPHRYGGEAVTATDPGEVAGTYEFLEFGTDISPSHPPKLPYEPPRSARLELKAGGEVRTADGSGSWRQASPTTLTVTLGRAGSPVRYTALLLRQWNPYLDGPVLTFTALSERGTAMWGSRLPAESLPGGSLPARP